MQWFRWYHGTCADPKLGSIARKVGTTRERVIATWALVLESASESADRGAFRVDADGIADVLNCDTAPIVAILAEMEARGMICGGRVAAWDRRNPKRDDSLERVRRHRERKKAGEDETRVTRYSNADETPPDTDTEEETDGGGTPPPRSIEEDGAGAPTAETDQVGVITDVIVLANRGMKDNPAIGECYNPIPHSHGRSRAAVAEWIKAGIPLRAIQRGVYRTASRFSPQKPGDQIRSLSYFDDAVRREWARLQANGAAAPQDDPARPNGAEPRLQEILAWQRSHEYDAAQLRLQYERAAKADGFAGEQLESETLRRYRAAVLELLDAEPATNGAHR